MASHKFIFACETPVVEAKRAVASLHEAVMIENDSGGINPANILVYEQIATHLVALHDNVANLLASFHAKGLLTGCPGGNVCER